MSSHTRPVPTTLCRTGPLVPHIEDFGAFLIGEGYAPYSLRIKYQLAGELSAWLESCGLSLVELNEQRFQQFYAQRDGGCRRGDARSEEQLLAFLRGRGVAPPVIANAERNAIDEVTAAYERFLRNERGVCATTQKVYLAIVRCFLWRSFRGKALDPADLQARHLHRFILQESRRVGVRQTERTMLVLRSFTRFLKARGLIRLDLSAAVTAAPAKYPAPLPKTLEPQEVRRLLASCDRRTPGGRRDYAILLLFARLGLRSSEVSSLTLDDLDWERGEIIVRGKGSRQDRLPLPRDVGAALVDYLRFVRPASPRRQVFIRMEAPWRGFSSSASLACLMSRALKRAGLSPPCRGTHLLRHSLATQLLRRGASLREIGQLLRHQQLKTTQIYTRVDIKALRGVAQRWMGGAP